LKATITLDRWDGSKSVSKTVYIEDIPMDQLRMYLMDQSTAAITITKEKSLIQIADKFLNPDGSDENQNKKDPG